MSRPFLPLPGRVRTRLSRLSRRTPAVLAVLAAVGPIVAEAAPPETISFQALLDSAGTPLAGTHDLAFSFYDSSAAGALLWSETHVGVPVDGGVASVLLGSVAPFAGVDFGSPVWLAVAVDGGTELSPRTALAGTPYAFVSGDVAGGYVRSLNGIQGDALIEAGPNVSVSQSGDTITIASTGATADGDWIVSGSDQYSAVAGNVGIGTASPAAKLEVRSTGTGTMGLDVNDHFYVRDSTFVGIGRSTPIFSTEYVGITFPNTTGYGGMMLRVNGPSGTPYLGFYTDTEYAYQYFEGTSQSWRLYNDGTRLTVQNDGLVGVGTTAPAERLEVAGNVGAQGSTRIGVFPGWSASSSYFWRDGNDYPTLFSGGLDTYLNAPAATGNVSLRSGATTKLWISNAIGDASANFLNSAVADYEILDEPGVASVSNGTTNVALTGIGLDILLSRSITPPTSGYLVVTATGQISVTHTNGATSTANFGVSSDSTFLPAHQDVALSISNTAPTGQYVFPVTVHDVFAVSGGSVLTFFFLGDEVSGNFTAIDMQLTLLFVPTLYGTVSVTDPRGPFVSDEDAPVRGPLTASEIAAERAESESTDRARIRAELEAFEARLEALEGRFEAEGGTR